MPRRGDRFRDGLGNRHNDDELREVALTPSPSLSPHQLSHHQVLQRRSDGGTTVSLDVGAGAVVRAVSSRGTVFAQATADARGVDLALPTGGPYDVVVADGSGTRTLAADVCVGDLWVLAGQSNMEGCGRMAGSLAAAPATAVLDMSGRWRPAADPVHRRGGSPYPVHRALEQKREAEAALAPASPIVFMDGQATADDLAVEGSVFGVGPGITFANELLSLTGVPVGLVPAAHGGTSLEDWSPTRAADGGESLFGAMLASVTAAGGAVTGVLWWQGESDAEPNRPWSYDEELASFFDGVRKHLGDQIRIVHVQIGRVAYPDETGQLARIWSRVREAQRLASGADGLVPAIDLDLDDPIHVGATGHAIAGRRLARVAAGLPAITLGGVEVDHDGLIVRVGFDGVTGRLTAGDTRPAGFTVTDVDGNDCGIVFHTEVGSDGRSIVLRLSRRLSAGDHLCYGFGLNPHCNVRDNAQMAVPAFGPLPLPSP